MEDRVERNEAVVDYWYKHYLRNSLCSLCGNTGKIDTRGIRSPAGVECGDVHYCICPNGQVERQLVHGNN